MPATLNHSVGSAISPLKLTDAQFDEISTLVKELAGINLSVGKKELVRARLGKRLRSLGMSDLAQYMDFVRSDKSGGELVAMLDALSTNLTSFFREPHHFRHLEHDILPKLLSVLKRRKIRIWSAGCSSGEEAYSIAISLAENVPGIEHFDAKILATDLSTKVLALARKGTYTASRVQSMPREFQLKYFTHTDDRHGRWYQVNSLLRRLTHFARLNLMAEWPMRGPFDVIFCRNVMIYFDKRTQARLIERMTSMLGPEGTLIIGHSESLAGIKHKLNYVEPTIYRK